jgi:hypothetical protein
MRAIAAKSTPLPGVKSMFASMSANCVWPFARSPATTAAFGVPAGTMAPTCLPMTPWNSRLVALPRTFGPAMEKPTLTMASSMTTTMRQV